MGYNDGIDRRLSNKGVVGVESSEGGRKKIVFCKIIGLISMNVATIDISQVKNPKLDATVIVYSDSDSNPNSISNASKLCETIPYELLIHLNPITKREVI
jgi:alanine racemase